MEAFSYVSARAVIRACPVVFNTLAPHSNVMYCKAVNQQCLHCGKFRN